MSPWTQTHASASDRVAACRIPSLLALPLTVCSHPNLPDERAFTPAKPDSTRVNRRAGGRRRRVGGRRQAC
eukprot:82512-Chlamydomonas_euryale.AAC.1